MGLIELFLIAVGLSMDAFAVSVCKGLAMKKCTWTKAGIVGLYFGVFQAGMPVIGYLLGSHFRNVINSVDHWIAFILLAFIGGNMLKEAFQCEDEEADDSLDVKTMLTLAVATSIDALAVGVTFAFLKVEIVPAVTLIGVTTFVLSCAGVRIGNIFGSRYQKGAQIAGGVILIFLGVKILVEHLGLL